MQYKRNAFNMQSYNVNRLVTKCQGNQYQTGLLQHVNTKFTLAMKATIQSIKMHIPFDF